MKSLRPFIVSVAALATFCPLAQAHFDFVPILSANKIFTGGHDDEAGLDVGSLVVGGYDFGEVPADPYNIGDPGFNTNGASGFSPGSALRFAGLSYHGAFLSYWDGTGDPTFVPAPTGVSLSISGSPTRRATFTGDSLTYSPASDTSLLIASFAGNGAIHTHLGSSIFFNGDQAADSVPTGAYVISFSLLNPATGVADSDPLYIVYNNGLDEEVHDAAIEAVAASVPEPAALALTLPALALLRRRR